MRRWLSGALAVIIGAVIGFLTPWVASLSGAFGTPFMFVFQVAEAVVPMPNTGNCMTDAVTEVVNASCVWAVIGALAGLAVAIVRARRASRGVPREPSPSA